MSYYVYDAFFPCISECVINVLLNFNNFYFRQKCSVPEDKKNVHEIEKAVSSLEHGVSSSVT